jgi:hypothetical protein
VLKGGIKMAGKSKNKKSCHRIKWSIIEIAVAVSLLVGLTIPIRHLMTKPLQISPGGTWTVLSLFSMLSVTYVQLINRLNEFFIKLKCSSEIKDKPERRMKASRSKHILSWSSVFLFASITALAVRIFYLAFHPDVGSGSAISHTGALLTIDSLILVTFGISSILRLVLFFQSYSDGLLIRKPERDQENCE